MRTGPVEPVKSGPFLLLKSTEDKGLVDVLFGRLRAWIRDYLMTTKTRIVDIYDLVAVLKRGAQTANERERGGARHIEERFEPEAKPAAVWRLDNVSSK